MIKDKYDLQNRYSPEKLDFITLFAEQGLMHLVQCYYWEQNWERIIYRRTMNRSFLYVVTGGNFKISDGETIRDIGPGQTIYMPAGQLHSALNKENNMVKAFGIHFHWQLPGYRTDTRLFRNFCLDIPHMDYWMENLSLLTALSNRNNGTRSRGCSEILKSLIIQLILVHETVPLIHTDERVNRAVEMILKEPNRWRKVPELAAKTGLSPSRFRTLFRQEMNVSPKTFIEKCRIDACASEMLSSDLSIKEIAAKNGFSSQQYFNQAFKRHLGSAPGEYKITS